MGRDYFNYNPAAIALNFPYTYARADGAPVDDDLAAQVRQLARSIVALRVEQGVLRTWYAVPAQVLAMFALVEVVKVVEAGA